MNLSGCAGGVRLVGVQYLDFPQVGQRLLRVEAEFSAAMIQSAPEVTVVTDSSKIGRSSLSLIAPITSVNRIITDGAIVVVPGLAGVAG